MGCVLLVDDSHHRRMVARIALECAGHTVLEVSDGMAGLESVTGDAPDCVLIDLHAPAADALEFLGRLDAASAPPVVVMGCAMRQETVEQCRDAGAVFCLIRPCTPAEVVTAAERAMKKRDAAASR